MPTQTVKTLIDWAIQVHVLSEDATDMQADANIVLLSPEVASEDSPQTIIVCPVPALVRAQLAALLLGQELEVAEAEDDGAQMTIEDDAAYGPEDAIARQQRCARCGSRDIDEQCDLLITEASNEGELEDAAAKHCSRAIAALEPDNPTDPRGD